MAHLISIPVTVDISVAGKEYGKFTLLPFSIRRGRHMAVDFWRLMRQGRVDDLNDVLIVEVMPRQLLSRVCRETFEEAEEGEDETLLVRFEIDDETWDFRLRARELEPEEVHYEIEIEGEWYRLSETYLRELVSVEMMAIGERVVSQSIDFADESVVMDDMI